MAGEIHHDKIELDMSAHNAEMANIKEMIAALINGSGGKSGNQKAKVTLEVETKGADKAAKDIKSVSDAMDELIQKLKNQGTRNSFYMPDFDDAQKALGKFYTSWKNMGDKTTGQQKKIMGDLFKMIAAFQAQFGDQSLFPDMSDETKRILQETKGFYDAIVKGKGVKLDGKDLSLNSFGIAGNAFDIDELRKHYEAIQDLTIKELKKLNGLIENEDGIRMGKAIGEALDGALEKATKDARQKAEQQGPIFKAKSFVDQNLKKDLINEIESILAEVDKILNKKKPIRDNNPIFLPSINKNNIDRYKTFVEEEIGKGVDISSQGVAIVQKGSDPKQIISLSELVDILNSKIQELNQHKKETNQIPLISKESAAALTTEGKQVTDLTEKARQLQTQLDQIARFDRETKGMGTANGIEALQALTQQGEAFGEAFKQARAEIDGTEQSAEKAIEKVKQKLKEMGVVFDKSGGFMKAEDAVEQKQGPRVTGEQFEKIKKKFIEQAASAFETGDDLEKVAEQYFDELVRAFDAVSGKSGDEAGRALEAFYKKLNDKSNAEWIKMGYERRAALGRLLGGVDVLSNEKLNTAMQSTFPEAYESMQRIAEEEKKAQREFNDRSKAFSEQTRKLGVKTAVSSMTKDAKSVFNKFFTDLQQQVEQKKVTIEDAIDQIKEKMKELNYTLQDGKFQKAATATATSSESSKDNTPPTTSKDKTKIRNKDNGDTVVESESSSNDTGELNQAGKINALSASLQKLAQMFEQAGNSEEAFKKKLKSMKKADIQSLLKDAFNDETEGTKETLIDTASKKFIETFKQRRDQMIEIIKSSDDYKAVNDESLLTAFINNTDKDLGRLDEIYDQFLKDLKAKKDEIAKKASESEEPTAQGKKTKENAPATGGDTAEKSKEAAEGMKEQGEAAKQTTKEIQTLAEMYEKAGQKLDDFKKKLQKFTVDDLKLMAKDQLDMGDLSKQKIKKADLVNMMADKYVASLNKGTTSTPAPQKETSAPPPTTTPSGDKAAAENTSQDLQKMGADLGNLKRKADECVMSIELLQKTTLFKDKDESYYTGLYEDIDELDKKIKELRDSLASLQIPDTETNLIDEKNKVLQVLDTATGSRDAYKQKIDEAKEVAKIIEDRQKELRERFMANADYEKYADPTWLDQYLERVKDQTVKIDDLYTEFADKLKKRKEEILAAEAQTESSTEPFTGASTEKQDEIQQELRETSEAATDAGKAGEQMGETIAEGAQKAESSLKVTEETLKRLLSLMTEFKRRSEIADAVDWIDDNAAENMSLDKIFDPNKFFKKLPNSKKSIEDYIKKMFYEQTATPSDLRDILMAAYSYKDDFGIGLTPEMEMFSDIKTKSGKNKAAMFGNIIGNYVEQWDDSTIKFREIRDQIVGMIQEIADATGVLIDQSSLLSDGSKSIKYSDTFQTDSALSWLERQIELARKAREELDKLNGESATGTDQSPTTEQQDKLQQEMIETGQTAEQAGQQVVDTQKQQRESVEETTDALKRQAEQAKETQDAISGIGYHGAKMEWKDDKFDVNRSKRSTLGAGLHLTTNYDDATVFASAPMTREMKQVEYNLEKCFILTNDYISSIETINKILGTHFDDTSSIKDIFQAIREYNFESDQKSKNFRQGMLDAGYQGFYANPTNENGTSLINQKITGGELVIYDEAKLDKIKTFAKQEFLQLTNPENQMHLIVNGEEQIVLATKVGDAAKDAGKKSEEAHKESAKSIEQEILALEKLEQKAKDTDYLSKIKTSADELRSKGRGGFEGITSLIKEANAEGLSQEQKQEKYDIASLLYSKEAALAKQNGMSVYSVVNPKGVNISDQLLKYGDKLGEIIQKQQQLNEEMKQEGATAEQTEEKTKTAHEQSNEAIQSEIQSLEKLQEEQRKATEEVEKLQNKYDRRVEMKQKIQEVSGQKKDRYAAASDLLKEDTEGLTSADKQKKYDLAAVLYSRYAQSAEKRKKTPNAITDANGIDISQQLRDKGRSVEAAINNIDNLEKQLNDAKAKLKSINDQIASLKQAPPDIVEPNAEQKTEEDVQETKQETKSLEELNKELEKQQALLRDLKTKKGIVRGSYEEFQQAISVANTEGQFNNGAKAPKNKDGTYDLGLLYDYARIKSREKNWNKAAAYYGTYYDAAKKQGQEPQDLFSNKQYSQSLLERYKDLQNIDLTIFDKQIEEAETAIAQLTTQIAENTEARKKNADATKQQADSQKELSKANSNAVPQTGGQSTSGQQPESVSQSQNTMSNDQKKKVINAVRMNFGRRLEAENVDLSTQENVDEYVKQLQTMMLYGRELGAEIGRWQEKYQAFINTLEIKPKETALDELKKDIEASGKTVKEAYREIVGTKGKSEKPAETKQQTPAPAAQPQQPTAQAPATTPGQAETPSAPVRSAEDIGAEVTKFVELETAVTKANQAILYKNSLLNAEKGIVDEGVGTEVTKLGELEQSVAKVNKAVLYKNSLFNEEKGIVAEAVNTEKDKLKELKDELSTGISEAIRAQIEEIKAMKAELESLSAQSSGEQPMTEEQKALQAEIAETTELLENQRTQFEGIAGIIAENRMLMYKTVPEGGAKAAMENLKKAYQDVQANPNDIKVLTSYNVALEQLQNLGDFDVSKYLDQGAIDKFEEYTDRLTIDLKRISDQIEETKQKLAGLQERAQQEFAETGTSADQSGEKMEQAQEEVQEKVAKTKRSIEELKQAYEELLAVYNQTGDKQSFIDALNKEFTGKNEIRTLARKGLDLHGEFNKGQWVSQIADQAESARLAAQGTVAQPDIPTEEADRATKEYEELKQSIEQVVAQIENLKTGLSSLDEKFMLDSEAEIFKELLNTLEVLIPDAIGVKNKAFEGEVSVVRGVVDQEKEILAELTKAIREVVEAINFKNVGLQDLGEVVKVLESLKGVLDAKSLNEFHDALDQVLQKLKEFQGVNVSDGIFSYIKDILSHADELRNFANILSESKEKIEEAAEAADAGTFNWKTVNIPLLDKEKWDNIINSASNLRDIVGNVVRITQQIRTSSKTGEQSISYRIAGDKADATVGANGHVLNTTANVFDREFNAQQDERLKELTTLETELIQSGQMTDELRSKIDGLFDVLSNASPHSKFKDYDKQLDGLKATIKEADEQANRFKRNWDTRLSAINKNSSKQMQQSFMSYIDGLVPVQADRFADSHDANGNWTGALQTVPFDNLLNKYKELEKQQLEYNKILQQSFSSNAPEQYQDALEDILAIIRRLKGEIREDAGGTFLDSLTEDQAEKLAQQVSKVDMAFSKGNDILLREQQKQQEKATKNTEVQWTQAEKAAKAYYDSAKKVKDLMDAIDAGAKDPNKFNVRRSLENAKKEMEYAKAEIERVMNTATSTPIGIGQKVTDANKIYNTYADVNGNITNPEFIRPENAANVYERLTKEAEKYYRILYKRDSGKSLTYNEKQYLEQMIPLYETLNSSASAYVEKLTEAQKQTLPQDYQMAVSTAKSKPIIDQFEASREKVDVLRNQPETAKLTAWLDEQQKRIADLQEEIANTPWIGQTEDDIARIDEVTDHVRKFEAEVNKATQNQDYVKVSENDKTQLNRRISEWIQNNSAAKDAIDQLKAYQAELQNIDDKGSLDNIELQFEKIKKEANDAGNVGKSFAEKLKGSFSNLARYLASFASFYQIVNVLRRGISVVKDLDKQFTEMRKVSDESVRSLKNYQFESFNIADRAATTASQIQQSTADWMRLGESLEEASKSAEISNVLFNVSEFSDINAATDSLVAMSQAFKELDKVEIIDKLNNIGLYCA